MSKHNRETRERTEGVLRRLFGAQPDARRRRPVVDEEFLARARAENEANREPPPRPEASPEPAPGPRPRPRSSGRRGDRS